MKLPEAKRGFALLPWRRVAERQFGWTRGFAPGLGLRATLRNPRRLHYVAFGLLILHEAASAVRVVFITHLDGGW